MTCSNPHCQSDRRDHLVLFSGGLCKECHSSGIAVLFQAIPEPPKQKKKMGRPVGEVPFDKAAYDKEFARKRNRESKLKMNEQYAFIGPPEKKVDLGVTIKGWFIIRMADGFYYNPDVRFVTPITRKRARKYRIYHQTKAKADMLGGVVEELV